VFDLANRDRGWVGRQGCGSGFLCGVNAPSGHANAGGGCVLCQRFMRRQAYRQPHNKMHVGGDVGCMPSGIHGVEFVFGITNEGRGCVGQPVRREQGLCGVEQSGPTNESGKITECQEGRDAASGYRVSTLCSASRWRLGWVD